MKSKLLVTLFLLHTLVMNLSIAQESQMTRVFIDQKFYPLYPEIFDEFPNVPSPFITKDGEQFLLGITKNLKYTIIPVTLGNEDAEYTQLKNRKGRQLDVDKADFPILAKTGIHSEIELDQTQTITGRSIAEITDSGRPDGSSGAGFMAKDEDIISVLKGDNRLVRKLGFTHPEIVKPLFHVYNTVLAQDQQRVWENETKKIICIFYHKRKIFISAGGKGWQESIFNDNIFGMYHLEMWRDLDENEQDFLSNKYSHLSDEELNNLIKKLSHIHTGEMVPYYAMRYGFYEGHTGFRADPVAITFIFGLKSLQEIDKAFAGNLDKVLFSHFTRAQF